MSSGGAYEYNQLQNGTTLAPFMLFNGTAISPTAGDTISVACTGLSSAASDSSLLTGVTSPLAAFVDKFSTAGTYGLNMFLGGVPTFVPTDNGPSRTTAANNGSLGASSGGIVEASYLSAAASAGATTLSLAGYRTGSSNGTGLPVALPSGSTLFIGCVASGTCAGTTGLYETVTTTAAYTAKAATISVTGLKNAYAAKHTCDRSLHLRDPLLRVPPTPMPRARPPRLR